MHSAKFIEVLKTFSKQEFKRFGTMIISPYFNSEKVLVMLYSILKNHYPDFSGKGMDKHTVFKKLYPGKDYNDVLMRNVFSDMLKLTEDYLLIESYKNDEFDSRLRLANELSRRKLIKLYQKNLDKAEVLVADKKAKDINYFKKILLIEQSKKSHEVTHKDIYINPNNTEQQISDSITIIFLMEILYRNLQLINIQKKYDFNYRLNFEKEIDQFLENSGRMYLEIAYIKYYYYTFKLLRSQDQKYYILLKDLIKTGIDELSPLEIRDIFTSLSNYCYVRITNGEDGFIKELFLNQKEMIYHNIYTTAAGNIPNVFFMNIVTTGLESEEILWVEQFIRERGEELKDDSKADTLHFCNAQLSYFKKDYDSALRELSAINVDDMTYKHNTKSLYLKLYFELNDIETFLSHVDSYKHFIAKNKLVFDKIKDSINNYIIFANRIFCIKNEIGKYDQYNLPELKREIIKCSPLINRPWLLRKIAEIE